MGPLQRAPDINGKGPGPGGKGPRIGGKGPESFSYASAFHPVQICIEID